MLELLNQMDGFDSMGDVKVGRQLCAYLGSMRLQVSVRHPLPVWPINRGIPSIHMCRAMSRAFFMLDITMPNTCL